jgi:hypothetical protein
MREGIERLLVFLSEIAMHGEICVAHSKSTAATSTAPVL